MDLNPKQKQTPLQNWLEEYVNHIFVVYYLAVLHDIVLASLYKKEGTAGIERTPLKHLWNRLL
jgi:hypothetical protein